MVVVVYNWISTVKVDRMKPYYFQFVIPDNELLWVWLDYLNSPLGQNYPKPNGMFHIHA